MSKRMMLISWRWDYLNLNNLEDTKIYLTENDDSILIYSDKINKKKLESRLKKLINEKNNTDLLILLHTGRSSEINENYIETLVGAFSYKRIYSFRGDSSPIDFIYANDSNNKQNGLIDEDGHFKFFIDSGYNVLEDDTIKQANFDSVWNHYYGEEGKKSPAEKEKQKRNLKQKKNDLIKLWLPLAIDIQGLSEVNDKTGYLNEVEEAWQEDDIEKLFDDHNDIIDNIEDKNISEFKIEENGGIYKLKNIKENIDELIDSNQDYFLPNFLHELIKTTDNIIEKQNS